MPLGPTIKNISSTPLPHVVKINDVGSVALLRIVLHMLKGVWLVKKGREEEERDRHV